MQMKTLGPKGDEFSERGHGAVVSEDIGPQREVDYEILH